MRNHPQCRSTVLGRTACLMIVCGGSVFPPAGCLDRKENPPHAISQACRATGGFLFTPLPHSTSRRPTLLSGRRPRIDLVSLHKDGVTLLDRQQATAMGRKAGVTTGGYRMTEAHPMQLGAVVATDRSPSSDSDCVPAGTSPIRGGVSPSLQPEPPVISTSKTL